MSLLPALFRRDDDAENRPLGPALKAAAQPAPDPVREFERGDHSGLRRFMFDPFLDSDLPAPVDAWRAEADKLCGVPDPTDETASELSNEIMNARRRALFDHMYLTANPPRIVSREGVDLGPLRVDAPPAFFGVGMGCPEGDRTVLSDGTVLWRGESQVDENGDVSRVSLVMSPMLPKPLPWAVNADPGFHDEMPVSWEDAIGGKAPKP